MTSEPLLLDPSPEKSPGSSHGAPVVRVVFCWAEVSRYMAACWRALARIPGVELHVIHPERLFGKVNPFLADPDILRDVSNETFREDQPDLDRHLVEAVERRQADIVVLCGWFFRSYRHLTRAPELAGSQFILGMDTPWRGTLLQRLGRFRFANLFRRIRLVVTAGERSGLYARRLGVPERKIRTGFYGFKYRAFSGVADQRPHEPENWPRRFLFVGRYIEKKGIRTLVEGYARYRASVEDPWELTCSGAGAERDLIAGVDGITDVGFTAPNDLPALFGRHGAFVMPSYYEPWGVALAEAAASGLPLVCSSACGAAVDLVRPYFNGLTVAPRDAADLAHALRWIHDHPAELPSMGLRGRALAEPYSAEAWAVRWHNYFIELLENR